jgi:hypothetical protein
MKLERTQTKAIESEDGENIYIEILDHVGYEDMYEKTKEEQDKNWRDRNVLLITKR